MSQWFAFNHYLERVPGLTKCIACTFQALLMQHLGRWGLGGRGGEGMWQKLGCLIWGKLLVLLLQHTEQFIRLNYHLCQYLRDCIIKWRTEDDACSLPNVLYKLTECTAHLATLQAWCTKLWCLAHILWLCPLLLVMWPLCYDYVKIESCTTLNTKNMLC